MPTESKSSSSLEPQSSWSLIYLSACIRYELVPMDCANLLKNARLNQENSLKVVKWAFLSWEVHNHDVRAQIRLGSAVVLL